MAGAIGTNVIKDGNGAVIAGGVRFFDVSGTGAGPWVPISYLYDPVSGALGTIKPASTAPVATDPALVVAISPNGQTPLGQSTMSASAPVVIASDQSPVKVNSVVSATANGGTASRVNAAATTNATNLKASAGQLYTIDVFNVAAYNVFLKLYNKASAPTLALATPVNSAFSTSTTGGTLAAGTYYYRVSAINANGETLASTETSQVTTGTTSTVTVNWGAVTGATGYKVYGRSTGAELLIATLGAVTTYTDTGSVTPSGALPTANTTADTPVMTIPIQAGGGYSKTWTMGLPFSTGISYAMTKLQADSDTTVLVAGDLTGNMLWI